MRHSIQYTLLDSDQLFPCDDTTWFTWTTSTTSSLTFISLLPLHVHLVIPPMFNLFWTSVNLTPSCWGTLMPMMSCGFHEWMIREPACAGNFSLTSFLPATFVSSTGIHRPASLLADAHHRQTSHWPPTPLHLRPCGQHMSPSDLTTYPTCGLVL